jgi:hypothetical protein
MEITRDQEITNEEAEAIKIAKIIINRSQLYQETPEYLNN